MLKLIGVLFDVSSTMAAPYYLTSDNISKEPKSHSLIDILTKATKNNNTDVFSILFGCKKNNNTTNFFDLLFEDNKNKKIIDFISLITEISNYEINVANPKKKFVKHMDKYLPKNIEDYLYNPNSPSNSSMSFLCGLITQHQNIRSKIFEKLPKLPPIRSLNGNQNEINKKINQIKNALYICIEELISNCFEKMKFDNNYKILKSKNLVNIMNKINALIKDIKPSSLSNEKNNFIDYLENRIYGDSFFTEACEKAVNIFESNKNKYHKKMLIIVTDGLSEGSDPTKYIKQLKENNVYVVVCYIGKNFQTNILYSDDSFNIKEEGALYLFKLSSKINYQSTIYQSLNKERWKLPNECRLFIPVNDQKSMNEFISLINKALDYEDINFTKLLNKVRDISLYSYINSFNAGIFESREQILGTCWANACAACIYLARKRILGREEIPFEVIRQHIITNYSLIGDDGNNAEFVLKKCKKEFGLRMEEVDEEEAKKAVKEGRPCIASFRLNGKQWYNFTHFFKNPSTKNGILDKDTINQEPPSNAKIKGNGGHAVVLIDVFENEEKENDNEENKNKNHLTFLNSWGSNFGDFGKIRVTNGNVLKDDITPQRKIKYYEVFWRTEDLTDEEINYFKENHEKVISKSLFDLMRSQEDIDAINNTEIECEKCDRILKADEYEGNILIVKCPTCGKKYEPKNEILRKCLYLKFILSDEKNKSMISEIRKDLNAWKCENISSLFNTNVKCVTSFDHYRLCICTSDYIKIYEIKHDNKFHEVARTLPNQRYNVNCIEEISENILASGEGTNIVIYKVENSIIRLIRTISNRHKEKINKIIKFEKGEFASCSKDGEIIFWTSQYEEKRINHGIKGINFFYYTYSLNNNYSKYLVCENYRNSHKSIDFWNIDNINNSILKKSFENIEISSSGNPITKLDNFICIGGKNEIILFNLDENIKMYSYKDRYEDLGNILSLGILYSQNANNENILLAGSEFGFIYLYKIYIDKNKKTLEPINLIRNDTRTLKGKTEFSVTYLTSFGQYIIANSKDGNTNMYKYQFIYPGMPDN